MCRIPTLGFFSLLQMFAAGAVSAHSGALDGNGCHYEKSTGRHRCHAHTRDLKPNPDAHAPVKKSREDICHDNSSSNYTSSEYCVSRETLAARLASGGRAPS